MRVSVRILYESFTARYLKQMSFTSFLGALFSNSQIQSKASRKKEVEGKR